MNSSGIKRGLAAGAISALAVTGLPFLATSASAAQGDSASMAYVGPVRNGGTQGGLVVLKTTGLDATDTSNLKLAGANGVVGDEDNGVQSADVTVVTPAVVADPSATPPVAAAPATYATFSPDAKSNEFGGQDGFGEMAFHVTSLTNAAGDPVKYIAFFDDNGNDKIDVGEAKVSVETATSGAPTAISVSPSTQSAAQGQDSDDYTVTLKDSAGRLTQLTDVETVAVTSTADIVNGTIDKASAERGSATFTASSSTVQVHDITVTGPDTDPGAGVSKATASATLSVIEAVTNLDASKQIDVVTGADTWNGFEGGTNAVTVRADQHAVKLDIQGGKDNAGKAVTLNLTGTGITFGGQATKTMTTVLDSNGLGSITITPDASSIAPGASFKANGAGLTDFTVTYANSQVSKVKPSATTYVGKFGGVVDTTVTVLDQFGNPAKGTFVTVTRTGANAGAESAKTAVDDAGKAVFHLTDSKADSAVNADTLTYKVYAGQYSTSDLAVASNPGSSIQWTADGLGRDFTLTANGNAVTASSYDPTKVFATPLTDTVANAASEYVALTLGGGGTTGAPITVSVDNGALVLAGTDTDLSDAAASVDSIVGDTFKIVGTKAGLVNVTVTTGGRTKTTKVSVHSLSEVAGDDTTKYAAAAATARNVAVSGPEKAVANQVVTFTALVTDAFGNPVVGVSADKLSTSVTGPARAAQPLADATDKNGALSYSVELDNDADSPVSLRVTADKAFAQFGALANNLVSSDKADAHTGMGLSASQNAGTAQIAKVVDIATLQAAVDAAQAKVDAAQDKLTADQGALTVAQAEQAVMQKRLDRARAAVVDAKAALAKAIKRGKGIWAAKRDLAEAKANRADARDNLDVATAATTAAQTVVTMDEARLAKAQADLDAAKKALADAQG